MNVCWCVCVIKCTYVLHVQRVYTLDYYLCEALFICFKKCCSNKVIINDGVHEWLRTTVRRWPRPLELSNYKFSMWPVIFRWTHLTCSSRWFFCAHIFFFSGCFSRLGAQWAWEQPLRQTMQSVKQHTQLLHSTGGHNIEIKLFLLKLVHSSTFLNVFNNMIFGSAFIVALRWSKTSLTL